MSFRLLNQMFIRFPVSINELTCSNKRIGEPMKNQNTNKSRRTVLKGLIGIPVVALTGLQTARAAMLSVDDPTAKALLYTDKSTKDGQNCANCGIYQGGDADSGPCPPCHRSIRYRRYRLHRPGV